MNGLIAPAGWRISFLVLVVALAASPGVGSSPVQQRTTRDAVLIDPAASRILLRARDWAGGAAALDAVRSIAFNGRRGAHPYGVRLLWPDRFQTRYLENPVVNTLNGSRFWQFPRGSDAVAAIARKNLAREFILQSFVFLLRTPSESRVELAAPTANLPGSFLGDAVSVSAADDFKVTFFFDRTDGRLVGYTRDVSMVLMGVPTAAPVTSATVTTLSDYRQVAGVRLPFRLDTAFSDGQGSSTTLQIDDFQINSLSGSDFEQRP